ncbi:MAG TPA: hypothetical protein VMX13_11085 [Sedimentisphaerales bacterium]|nr:hypothetical protein [Sedimentisphaerales bacterium]
MLGVSQNGYQYIAFKVHDRPYCLWGVDLPQRNLEAIHNIDSEHFDFLAQLYCEKLQSEHKQNVALAIRMAYGHALETLFSLICATLQAPFCFYAWMLKYRPSDVPRMIREIRNHNFHLYLSPSYNVKLSSWKDFSMMIHLVQGEEQNANIAIKFGEFWQKLSSEFIDENFRNEYNSIKHGCRVKSGGFSISVGLEHIPGVAPSKDKMKPLGGSEFGTSFFLAQEIKGNILGRDPNFKTRRLSLNWNAENNVHALTLISLSIHNIKSFLKHVNHVEEVTFSFPEELELFEMPWKKKPGVLNCSFDLNLDDTKIIKKTCNDIEAIFVKAQDKKVNN